MSQIYSMQIFRSTQTEYRDAIRNDEKEMLSICCASFAFIPIERFELIVLCLLMKMVVCAFVPMWIESLPVSQSLNMWPLFAKQYEMLFRINVPQQWTLS